MRRPRCRRRDVSHLARRWGCNSGGGGGFLLLQTPEDSWKRSVCVYLQLRLGDFPAFVQVQGRERVPDRLQEFVPQRHDGGFPLVSGPFCRSLSVWAVCWTRRGQSHVTRCQTRGAFGVTDRRAAAPLSERREPGGRQASGTVLQSRSTLCRLYFKY